jgi:hypothetical protein
LKTLARSYSYPKLLIILLLIIQLIPGAYEAALTACNETGLEYSEGSRVLQVAVNRALYRDIPLVTVLKEKHQFNLKKCELSLGHFILGIEATKNSLIVPSILIDERIRYYDSLWSQERLSNKCPGYTVGDMWEHAGLVPVCKSPINHIFFKQTGNNPGCPSSDWKPTKRYKGKLRKC